MTNRQSQLLFERVAERVRAAGESLELLVPVDDPEIFGSVADEMLRTVASDASGESDVVFFVDSQTAGQIDAAEDVRRIARKAYHFGTTIAQSWAAAGNTEACGTNGCVGSDDRLAIVLSRYWAFAIVGNNDPDKYDEEGSFSGAWTSDPAVVRIIAISLMGPSAPSLELPEVETGDKENPERLPLKLTAIMARQLAARQRKYAQDKDDLNSVLNILKSISAKRRVHDILYVFARQIADVIQMDRCSVVRVLDGDNHGHVLASHEDSSIRDLVIDLNKYPEVYRAIETNETVLINNVFEDPLTRPFAQKLRDSDIHLQSLLVIPMVLSDPNIGSFLLRAARSTGPFTEREVSFCQIVAGAAANALERTYLLESIQRANEQLEYLAVTDGLTGLYNHRFFRERLEEEFERARRYDLPLSCLILDIDDFKKVNDTHGHLQGDLILREIAVRTSQMVRKSDIVARYGGEEFVVVMPQTGIEGARSQADRIRKDIGHRPYEGLPEDTRITVSIGVAEYDRETMLDCEALIRAADGALYEAKRTGKDRVLIGTS